MDLLGRSRAVLLLPAVASAVTWAVGMTVLQPMSEPAGPGEYGEINTYWARELRWGALIALVIVLFVFARGGRGAGPRVVAGGFLWVAADIGLDRADLAAGTAQLAIGAALAARLCCAAVSAAPGEPRPKVLFVAAAVAAVASGLATGTESPDDVERALTVGSAAVGSLLALVAVIAAAHAAGSVSRPRVLAALRAGGLVASMPWLLRYAFPQPGGGRMLAVLGFTVVLVVTVVSLAGPPRSRQHRHDYPVVAAVAALVLPAMFLPLGLLAVVLRIGEPFTRLAANPPIGPADEDAVVIILAIPVGLVLGAVLHGFARTREDRPVHAGGSPAISEHAIQ